MSDSTGDRAYARDARKQTVTVWVGLVTFFIGCGLLTIAVIELASNKSVSVVTGLIGGTLFVVGLVLVVIRGHLGGER